MTLLLLLNAVETGEEPPVVVVSPGTLADLRAQIRLTLTSGTDWPDDVLDGYIRQAIRFYSNEFPWRGYGSVALTTGTQRYVLSADWMNVLAVEYPEDTWLMLLPPWDARFDDAGYWIASVGVGPENRYLLLGPEAETGESAVVWYEAVHPVPEIGDDDFEITVPVNHWEALGAFVDFCCHWQLEAGEAVTVSNVSIVLSQLGQESRLAWRRFQEILAKLRATMVEPVGVVSWAGIGL